MKKCPDCEFLNPDNAIICDCGKNLISVEILDLEKEKRLKRKNIIIVVILLIIILPVFQYLGIKNYFTDDENHLGLLYKFFDLIHVDYLYGTLVIMIIACYIYKNDIKNWKIIYTSQKFIIVATILFTIIILLVCVVRIAGLVPIDLKK